MAFRMRHQSQDSPSRVTNTRHVALRAVGIPRIAGGLTALISIAQYYLPRLTQVFQRRLVAAEEPPFAVSDRQVQDVDAGKEWASSRVGLYVDPAILEPQG